MSQVCPVCFIGPQDETPASVSTGSKSGTNSLPAVWKLLDPEFLGENWGMHHIFFFFSSITDFLKELMCQFL